MTGEPLSTAALLKISIGTAVAGAGVAAYGQYQSGKAAQSQAKAQSAFNLYNAKVSQRQAEAEEEAAAFESGQQKKRAKTFQDKLRARRGASGVEAEGSPLLVAEDNAAEFAKEATNIRLTGQRREQAFRSQSILDVSKASAAKTRAAGFGRAAITGAGGSILQGASQVAFIKSQA